MFGVEPLTAAYGRKYKNIAEMTKDWNDNLDFMTVSGRYTNKSDLGKMYGNRTVLVRYGKDNKKVGVLKT